MLGHNAYSRPEYLNVTGMTLEELHFTQRCPHFRGLEERESIVKGVLISRVGIEEFHCIQRCPHFRGWNRAVPLYTEVSSFHGIGRERTHCIRCPHFRVLE